MKIFEKGNWKKDVCLICKTRNNGPVSLLAISGTEEGFNVQAKQVHIDCLNLWIDLNAGIIFQKF